MLSDCKEYLVSTLTDDRGELLETWVMPYADQNRFALFRTLWDLAKQILNRTQQYNWKIVIGKYGSISPEEMKGNLASNHSNS